jgi:hypothetical protein
MIGDDIGKGVRMPGAWNHKHGTAVIAKLLGVGACVSLRLCSYSFRLGQGLVPG